jgi:hypothetical protein
MPYIETKKFNKVLLGIGMAADTAGELNYQITMMIKKSPRLRGSPTRQSMMWLELLRERRQSTSAVSWSLTKMQSLLRTGMFTNDSRRRHG